MDSCAPASQPKLAFFDNNLPSTVCSHLITSAHSAVKIDDAIPVSTAEMHIERRLQCKRWTASEEFAATQCRAKWLKKVPKPGAYPCNFSPFVMQAQKVSETHEFSMLCTLLPVRIEGRAQVFRLTTIPRTVDPAPSPLQTLTSSLEPAKNVTRLIKREVNHDINTLRRLCVAAPEAPGVNAFFEHGMPVTPSSCSPRSCSSESALSSHQTPVHMHGTALSLLQSSQLAPVCGNWATRGSPRDMSPSFSFTPSFFSSSLGDGTERSAGVRQLISGKKKAARSSDGVKLGRSSTGRGGRAITIPKRFLDDVDAPRKRSQSD